MPVCVSGVERLRQGEANTSAKRACRRLSLNGDSIDSFQLPFWILSVLRILKRIEEVANVRFSGNAGVHPANWRREH